MEKYSQAYFIKQGKIGGDTYAQKYTKKQRSEIAKKRWAKMKAPLDKKDINTV